LVISTFRKGIGYMSIWKKVCLHHSLTKDGVVADWQAIRRFHTSWRIGGTIVTEKEAREAIRNGEKNVVAPWLDIGYHFGVEKVNDHYEILAGRPLNISGAHCTGQNNIAIGLLFVGNYDIEDPPQEMLLYGAKFLKGLMIELDIFKDEVYGHSTFASYKSCPGTKFDVDNFKKLLGRV